MPMAAATTLRIEPHPTYAPLPSHLQKDPRFGRYNLLPANEYQALGLWLGTFFPFQLDWVLESSKFAICNKSRRIGITYASAAAAVVWGAFHGETTTIISIGAKESEEVLSVCRRHVDILQALGSECANTVKSNTDEIVFASGGRILALPASGGRSFGGNVLLDEYAHQSHDSEVWKAASAVALHGFKIRVVSTPNGIGNEFYDLWEIATNPDRQKTLRKRKHPWKAHLLPIEVAIEQGFPVDIDDCWDTANGDPRLFAQEYQCSFLDGVLQYIPTDVITSCTTEKILTAPAVGEFYGGLDIGREVDLTCLIIICRIGQMVSVVHVEIMRRTDSDGLEAMIDRAFARYKLRRLCIDCTGLGTFPVDRIKKKHSERIEVSHRRPRVEAITFTPLNKEALATGLYTTMTSQLVEIPATDAQLPFATGSDNNPLFEGVPRTWKINEPGTAKKLQREIASIRRVITTSGNIQYSTPRTSEGHADRAWSLMLALHARVGSNPMIDALRQRMKTGSRKHQD